MSRSSPPIQVRCEVAASVPEVPSWLPTVWREVSGPDSRLHQFAPPPNHSARESAVLMLFGPVGIPGPPGATVRTGAESTDSVSGVDVLLTKRASQLRSHPGQVSFPGGRIESADAGPVAAALREAEEEVGVDPDTVTVVGALPRLYLSPSNHVVTPVLAWWSRPHQHRVADPREVALADRVPLSDLVDPTNRFSVQTSAGYRGPAVEASGMFIWGFTAGLLFDIADAAGWSSPWDYGVVRSIPSDAGPQPSQEHLE